MQNVTGDEVKKLDILSNEIMCNMLKMSGRTSILISEELEEPIICDQEGGHYCVVFDPLDGSSNIDCGVSVGTIFGVYKLNLTSGESLVDQIKKPGSNMIAGGVPNL